MEVNAFLGAAADLYGQQQRLPLLRQAQSRAAARSTSWVAGKSPPEGSSNTSDSAEPVGLRVHIGIAGRAFVPATIVKVPSSVSFPFTGSSVASDPHGGTRLLFDRLATNSRSRGLPRPSPGEGFSEVRFQNASNLEARNLTRVDPGKP